MKKIFFLIPVSFLFACMLTAQTAGTLTVSFTTSSAGGEYSPRNVLAVWIEDDQGSFVKTLLVNANRRETHLNNWQASTNAAGSEFNHTDAITGATNPNYGARTCSWDGTDISSQLVADGTYILKMELTDKNSTGNLTEVSFLKGSDPQSITPENAPSFSSIAIDWAFPVTDVQTVISLNEYKVFPNPSTGMIHIRGKNIIETEVCDFTGKRIFKTNISEIDLGNYPSGIYWFKIRTEEGSFVHKVVKY